MYGKNKEDSKYADRWNIVEIIILLAVVCLYIGLTWYGSSGLRGTDDLWYVADVESLITGHGAHTNNIFPVSVINGICDLPRPFIHNTLNIYFAAIPSLIFGAYKGWIVTNIISSLLTSYIIYLIVRDITGHKSAIFAGLTYLIMPLTLLQSIKPMAEASIAPLAALVLFIYMRIDEKLYKWIVLMIMSGILAICRLSFLPVLLVVPFLYLIKIKKINSRVISGMLLLFFIGAAIIKVNGILFKPNAAFSYTQIVNSAVPGKSNNMNLYFDLHPPKITLAETIENIKLKAIDGFRMQFGDVKSLYKVKYYLPYNLMFLCGIILLYKWRDKKCFKISMAALFFYGIHILTIILFQNQERYMLPSLPIMVIAFAVFLGSLNRFILSKENIISIVLAIMIVVCVPYNAKWSRQSHVEYWSYIEMYKNLSSSFNSLIPENDTVIVEAMDPWQYLMHGHFLRPREVLFVPDNYEKKDYDTLVKNVNGKWLICRNNSPILNKMKDKIKGEFKPLPQPFEYYNIYYLKDGSNTK